MAGCTGEQADSAGKAASSSSGGWPLQLLQLGQEEFVDLRVLGELQQHVVRRYKDRDVGLSQKNFKAKSWDCIAR